MITWLALYASHILTDFYLQPAKWVSEKISKKHLAWQLYAHALIAGLLAYIAIGIVQSWQLWWVILAVAMPHFLIDLWKLSKNGESKFFVIDQIAHFIHLGIVFLMLTKPTMNISLLESIGVIAFGAILLWQPSGILIGKLTESYRNNLAEEDKSTSLPKAGKAIGVLERLLIFVFILLGEFSAIGFLITAKSILRFSDNKDAKNPVRMSEYIIIGTLMSFLIAITVSLLTKYVLSVL